MRLILLAVSFLALAFPAAAVETGTPAWSIKALTVFQGPGTAYDIVGDISGKIRIRVDRCTYRWCLVRAEGVRGWVSRDAVAFGQEPKGPFTGPRLKYKSGGPGLVCLYEGRNYTGAAICLPSGTYRKDLLLEDLDNRYSSVSIEGDVSITLCRDRDYSSYCERFNESDPRLPGFLDNNVSSLRVH
jgi:uncharacterized protein YraI